VGPLRRTCCCGGLIRFSSLKQQLTTQTLNIKIGPPLHVLSSRIKFPYLYRHIFGHSSSRQNLSRAEDLIQAYFMDYAFLVSYRGLQRDVVYLGWPIAPSFMSPNAGEGGCCLRGLSQWVQLHTGAQRNFGDLTPYLTYMVSYFR
jgi:hypothetical protein